jgi:hypothetical protein
MHASPWGGDANAVLGAPWYPEMKRTHTFKRRQMPLNIPYYTSIDCANIARANNFAAIETLLPDITLCNVSHADAATMTPAQIVNLVRVMQLGLEYLDAVRASLLTDSQRQAQRVRALEVQVADGAGHASSRSVTLAGGAAAGVTMSNEQYRELLAHVKQASASAVTAAASARTAAPAAAAAPVVDARLQGSLDRTTVEIAQLRAQLGEFAATIQARDGALAAEFERRDAERREVERLKYAKAFEVEERSRALKQEQEILNRERLLNLEKERLERARLAMELERQQQESAANASSADMAALQRQLLLQLQQWSTTLQAPQQQQVPLLRAPSPALPALMPPMPEAAVSVAPPPVMTAAAPPAPMAAPAPPAPPRPQDLYRLYISCQDLPKTDWFSQADPFLVLLTAPKHSIPQFSKAPAPGWAVHTISPVIWDTPNPVWALPIVVNWPVDEDLALHFQVWDSDTKDAISLNNYMKQEFVGSAALTLHSVAAQDKLDKMWSFQLLSTKGKPLKAGRLQIRALSTNAENEAARKRQEDDDARAAAERAAREAAENAERARRDEEARLAAELAALRRKQGEEEALRRGREDAQRALAAREREVAEKKRELETHVAMESVYAERMQAMVVWSVRLSCRGMPDRDGGMRRSEPFVVLMSTELQKGLSGIQAQPQKVVGMTEVSSGGVTAGAAIDFARPVSLQCPEFEDQMLEFQAWQSDIGGGVSENNYSNQTYVGSATLALAQVNKSGGMPVTVPLSSRGKNTGSDVTVVARRDDEASAIWRGRVAGLLEQYRQRGEQLRGEVSYLERLLQEERARVAAM